MVRGSPLRGEHLTMRELVLSLSKDGSKLASLAPHQEGG